MRELSGHDPLRAEALLRFPVRELVCNWFVQRRQEAARRHQFERLEYALVAPYAEKGKLKPPALPDILKD